MKACHRFSSRWPAFSPVVCQSGPNALFLRALSTSGSALPGQWQFSSRILSCLVAEGIDKPAAPLNGAAVLRPLPAGDPPSRRGSRSPCSVRIRGLPKSEPFPSPLTSSDGPPEHRAWRQRLVFVGARPLACHVEPSAGLREVRPLAPGASPPQARLHGCMSTGRWPLPIQKSLQDQGAVFHGFVPGPSPRRSPAASRGESVFTARPAHEVC